MGEGEGQPWHRPLCGLTVNWAISCLMQFHSWDINLKIHQPTQGVSGFFVHIMVWILKIMEIFLLWIIYSSCIETMYIIYLYTMPIEKTVARSNISLSRLLHWSRSAFAVPLFRQPYAMSQHVFPSRVAFIFGRDFVLRRGESNYSFSLFQHIPKTFNGVKSGLCGGQFTCENVIMLHSFTTRARLILALSSWNMPSRKK